MDNQQRSPDEGNVQRSSRKRVLDFIIWETPRADGKYYIYKLIDSRKKEIPKYFGITADPFTRMSHHLSDSNLLKNSPKNSWIKNVLSNNEQVLMVVFNSEDTLENALIDEDFVEYKNNQNKKIICLNDNNIFNTIKEASLYYKIDVSCITKCCKGKRKTAGKMSFKYLL